MKLMKKASLLVMTATISIAAYAGYSGVMQGYSTRNTEKNACSMAYDNAFKGATQFCSYKQGVASFERGGCRTEPSGDRFHAYVDSRFECYGW